MDISNRAALAGALQALNRQQKINMLKALASGKAGLEDAILGEDFSFIIVYGNNGSPVYIGNYVYTEAEFTGLLKRHNKTFAQLPCSIVINTPFPESWVRLPRYADRFKRNNQKP